MDELLLSSPLELREHFRIETNNDLVDFCETNQVPKNLEKKYFDCKKDIINDLLYRLKRTKKTIDKYTFKSSPTYNPTVLNLDIIPSLISHKLNLNEWYLFKKNNKTTDLVFLIDNSASIHFSKRFDIAKSMGEILLSFYEVPRVKIILFSEKTKIYDLNKINIESFIKDYLSFKSSGYTDFNSALMELNNLQKNNPKLKAIIISDGISSVGKKMAKVDFLIGKIHYLKIGDKKSIVNDILEDEVKSKNGRIINIYNNKNLTKSLYQIIKRI